MTPETAPEMDAVAPVVPSYDFGDGTVVHPFHETLYPQAKPWKPGARIIYQSQSDPDVQYVLTIGAKGKPSGFTTLRTVKNAVAAQKQAAVKGLAAGISSWRRMQEQIHAKAQPATEIRFFEAQSDEPLQFDPSVAEQLESLRAAIETTEDAGLKELLSAAALRIENLQSDSLVFQEQLRRLEKEHRRLTNPDADDSAVVFCMAQPSFKRLKLLMQAMATVKVDGAGNPVDLAEWFEPAAKAVFQLVLIKGKEDKRPLFDSDEEVEEFIADDTCGFLALRLFMRIKTDVLDFLP
jgi:hypothetical protein